MGRLLLAVLRGYRRQRTQFSFHLFKKTNTTLTQFKDVGSRMVVESESRSVVTYFVSVLLRMRLYFR